MSMMGDAHARCKGSGMAPNAGCVPMKLDAVTGELVPDDNTELGSVGLPEPTAMSDDQLTAWRAHLAAKRQSTSPFVAGAASIGPARPAPSPAPLPAPLTVSVPAPSAPASSGGSSRRPRGALKAETKAIVNRVIYWLQINGGEFESRDGLATGKLLAKVGVSEPTIQQRQAVLHDPRLVCKVNGKRCSHIGLAPGVEIIAVAEPTVPIEEPADLSAEEPVEPPEEPATEIVEVTGPELVLDRPIDGSRTRWGTNRLIEERVVRWLAVNGREFGSSDGRTTSKLLVKAGILPEGQKPTRAQCDAVLKSPRLDCEIRGKLCFGIGLKPGVEISATVEPAVPVEEPTVPPAEEPVEPALPAVAVEATALQAENERLQAENRRLEAELAAAQADQAELARLKAALSEALPKT